MEVSQFVILPGSTKEQFENAPFVDDTSKYRTTQYYVQALLKHCPDDIQKLITCPEGEDTQQWIIGNYKQFLIELNYYAYAHRDVSTAASEPTMEFDIRGVKVSCLSAAYTPPRPVPAIDYITQTIDMATQVILDSKTFSASGISGNGMVLLQTFSRRLYRIFMYSWKLHRDIFESIENKTHICERFTKFCSTYGLLKAEEILIPQEYWTARSNNQPFNE